METPTKRKRGKSGVQKCRQGPSLGTHSETRKVKETLTEVKISVIRKRTVETNEKKTYQSTDRVTVLGLVCEKMTERVVFARQDEEDRRVRQEVCIITQDDEDMVDDDGFQDDREIWEVTHCA